MPRLNGFEVLARLPAQPIVVFTTAHDQYALDAFAVNSVDYLLKPVDPGDLDRALGRVERLRSRVDLSPPDLQGLAQDLADSLWRSRPEYPERIASRLGERLWFIDLDRVTHFFAEDKLTYAVEGGKPYCVDYTIVAARARCSIRGTSSASTAARIVNASWIKEVTTLPGGSLNLRLKDAKGTDLAVSRDRARAFKTRLLGR